MTPSFRQLTSCRQDINASHNHSLPRKQFVARKAQSASLNNQYLELLLTEIPMHMDDDNLKFLDELLPWSPRVQKECPSRYKKK